MLVRVFVDNFMSFGKGMEFNMIPNHRYSRLNDHKYKLNDFGLLKLAAIYGNNASGKSNLVKALMYIKELVIDEQIPTGNKLKKFRLHKDISEDKPITIGVEFIIEKKAFIYAVEIEDSYIKKEELYESGLGVTDDEILFIRTSNENSVDVEFFEKFYEEKENKLLLTVLKKNIFKANRSVLKTLANLDNDMLVRIKDAMLWFEDSLRIIEPGDRYQGLAQIIGANNENLEFAKELLCSYHVGIKDIVVEGVTLNRFFGEDNKEYSKEIRQQLIENPKVMASIIADNGEEVVAVNENGNIHIKRLKILHSGHNGGEYFKMNEESDGTRRLLNFMPAINSLVNEESVYIIDEIESSLHPIIIKGIIKKFSLDNNTSGQLIFTTHESNLLDQEILRKDEIWFTEKDDSGATDLYSLSKFQEHPTIDIRKGYLNGRYGGIPFMGNLITLNWHSDDSGKK